MESSRRSDASINVLRIVPNHVTPDPAQFRTFYQSFLGLDVAMDMGWIVTFASPTNSAAQITVLRDDPTTPQPAVSVEVDDVDAAYRRAGEQNLRIVYALRDEPWGVRRFFVADPSGKVVNVMQHVAPNVDDL